MNGIGLLVLIAAAGQLSAAQPMAQNQNRDWGWEIDRDKTLCYIIQLSPEKLQQMQNTGWELASDMPEELVGRATKVVIRLGTNLLPQTPSREELKTMPRVNSPVDVTAQLGPGRISDVETDRLQQVQQDRSAPTLPSFSNAPSPQSLDPNANLADQAQAALNAQAEKLKNFVRGTPAIPDARSGLGLGASNTNPATAATGNSPALPGFPGSSSAPNKFNSPTIPNPLDGRANNASNSTNWQTAAPPAYGQGVNDQQRTRDDMSRLADNRFPTSPNPTDYGAPPGTQTGTQNSGYGQGTYAGNGGYVPRDPTSLEQEMFNRLPSRQTPGGGFGSNNGVGYPGNYTSTNTGPLSDGYPPNNFDGRSNPNYNPNGMPSNSGYNPNGMPNNNGFTGDGVSRVAGNPIGNNGQPGNIAPVTIPTTTMVTTNKSGEASEPTIHPGKTKTAENILPVLFLLSLVVNFYLGMLIRKLLTRYRVLLANSRGHTTSNAYS